MANRRFIDFPIAASVGDNDIVLIWQDGLNKQTTKATLLQGSPQSLAGLTDVDIAGLTNGQILQYNSTLGKWENVDRTDINLSELGDVTIVAPTNGQVLVYNSSTSKWENSSGGYVPYTGAVTTVNLGAQTIQAGSFVKAGGTSAQFLKADGSVDSNTYLTTGSASATYVPYTGATADVNLGTHDLTAERGTFENNGSSNTLTVNHTSGSGYGIIVTKGGNNEALYVSKTSGSGNAMTVVGGRTSLVDLELSSVSNTAGDFLTLSGGVVHKRTAAQVLTDIGGQAALTNPVTGTGTAGQVAFWNGTSSQTGDNALFWDNTNKRLGIGTASPLAENLLQVSRNINGQNIVSIENANTGTGAYAEFQARNTNASNSTSLRVMAMGTGWTTAGGFVQNSGVLNADISLTGGLSIMTRANANMRFYTNGHTNERMRITAAGRVLIGTPPAPESTFQLDVNGSTRFNGLSTIQGTTDSDSGQLGTELLTTGTGDASWTGTDFATGYTHVAGSTTTLTSTLAGVVNTFYQITYTVTGRTAGSFTIGFGGFISGNLTATGAVGPQATTTGTLVITPTSDFNGTIVLSIRVISASSASVTFNNSAGAVTNQIRISSLNTNTFIGLNSGRRNTTGGQNTFFGSNAGTNNTTGGSNSFFGESAGILNTTGVNNSFFGRNSGDANTTGVNNSFFGTNSGGGNTTGGQNSFFGISAGLANTTGSNNVSLGQSSSLNNITGSQNVFIGNDAGRFAGAGTTAMTSVNNSIYLGYQSRGLNATGSTNELVIGVNVVGLGSNTTSLGNTSTTHGRWYGNLLLGTNTNSTFILDVNGTARIQSNLTVTATNATGDFATIDGSNIIRRRTAAQVLTDIGAQAALTNPVTGTGTTNYLPKFTGSTTIGNSQVFDNGTNVGIGTGSSGGGRLNIQNIASNPVINIRSTNNVFDILTMTFDESTDLFSITNKQAFAASGIAFGTNNLERVRITQPGNLLVGTTTDNGARLHVSGQGTFSGSVQINTNTTGLILNRGAVTNYTGVGYLTNGIGQWFVGMRENLSSNNYIIYNENGTDALTISKSNSAATFSNQITSGSWINTPNTFGLTIRNAANTAFRTAVQMNSSNVLIFGQDSDITALTFGVGSEAMRITSGGNVGIGTSSPGQRLVVENSTDTFLQLRNSAAGQNFFIGALNGEARLNNDNSTPITMWVNGSEQMRITSGGNVLIGTATNGASKLRISGLPTSAAGLSSGDVWNDGGTLKIA
jgi:hypothetical protein